MQYSFFSPYKSGFGGSSYGHWHDWRASSELSSTEGSDFPRIQDRIWTKKSEIQKYRVYL